MLLLAWMACETDKLLPHTGEAAETGETALETGTAASEVWEEDCEPVRVALEEARRTAGASGGAVAVWADGALVCAFGVGERGPDDPLPADQETLFRVADLTTTLTAIALFKRALTELEDVDTPVTDIIHGWNFVRDESWAERVTLRHALQRTAGLVDVYEIAADPDDDKLASYMVDTYPATRWLSSEPGAMWNLSFPTDALSGLLVEFFAGVRYRQTLRLQVLDQLGMHDTVFLAADVREHGNAASAWTEDWTGETDAPRLSDAGAYDNGWARPSAYAWSNALDMGALLGFLLEGEDTLIDDEARPRLWTEPIETGLCPGSVGYGYGLYVHDGLTLAGSAYSGTFLTQSGGLPGFSAALLASPETGVGAVALLSADDADLDQTLAAVLDGWTEAGAPAEDEGEDEDEAISLEGLAGTYVDPWTYGVLQVTVEEEVVSISAPLLDLYETSYEPVLEPVCQDNFSFTLEGEPMALSFLRPAPGEPAQLLRARGFVAAREEALTLWAPLPSPPARPSGSDPALRLLRRAAPPAPQSAPSER